MLFVTGRLGNSFLSEHHLEFVPRVEEGEFLAGKYTTCMMDISDGLLIDLQRLSIASHIGFELNLESIPLRDGATVKMGLNDGEDYELLFTVPQEKVDELYANWRFDTLLTCIGSSIVGRGKVVDVKTKASLFESSTKGYDHFQQDN
jgi:thiamine-monophosphate kinase